jgi:hypothetical protein
MKKLKIGFADTHEHLQMFFVDILQQRYDVEVDNKTPDYLLFGDDNFGTSNKQFSKDDCIKIFYTGENRRPEHYDCHYAITFDHNYNPWHYRLPLFVIYMWALKNIHKTKYGKNYIFKPEIKPKDRFCSFVVKNPMCRERNEFFKNLNHKKRVDSGGPLFNTTDTTLDGEEAKIDFLATRKFNICFESMSYPGYVTEKILHAFYSGTIPIYWGSPTIESDFNRDSFINVYRFETHRHAIDFVLKVDDNQPLYDEILNAPKFINNIPPTYLLYNNFLNWFDSVVYQKILAR